MNECDVVLHLEREQVSHVELRENWQSLHEAVFVQPEIFIVRFDVLEYKTSRRSNI